jgi:hypothetical protein
LITREQKGHDESGTNECVLDEFWRECCFFFWTRQVQEEEIAIRIVALPMVVTPDDSGEEHGSPDVSMSLIGRDIYGSGK